MTEKRVFITLPIKAIERINEIVVNDHVFENQEDFIIYSVLKQLEKRYLNAKGC